jgi:DNA-binding XRE family transcriptional regulator
VNIGVYVQQARERRSFSRAELAKCCGVSRTYVYCIEKGEDVPSAALCESLTDMLHLNKDEVLLAAGHVPEDILNILREAPEAACQLIRDKLAPLAKCQVERVSI